MGLTGELKLTKVLCKQVTEWIVYIYICKINKYKVIMRVFLSCVLIGYMLGFLSYQYDLIVAD